MKYLETEEEKKSFVITSILFVLMFLLFFYLGLTSLDPPPENGIAINLELPNLAQERYNQRNNSIRHHNLRQQNKPASSDDEVLAQDIEEAVVIKQVKKAQPTKQVATEEIPQSLRKSKTFKKHF